MPRSHRGFASREHYEVDHIGCDNAARCCQHVGGGMKWKADQADCRKHFEAGATVAVVEEEEAEWTKLYGEKQQ